MTLLKLSIVTVSVGHPEEAVPLAKEALEIFEQLQDTARQAQCLSQIAMSFLRADQVDTAEETASQAITLLQENSNPFIVFKCHHALGEVYRLKGNHEKAIVHFEVALGIASSRNWHNRTFSVYYY